MTIEKRGNFLESRKAGVSFWEAIKGGRAWIGLQPGDIHHGLKVIDEDTVELRTGYCSGSIEFRDTVKLYKDAVNARLKPTNKNWAIQWKPSPSSSQEENPGRVIELTTVLFKGSHNLVVRARVQRT